ncbi:period circadian protein homolog 1b isoform X2 [Stigmatopora nigra]
MSYDISQAAARGDNGGGGGGEDDDQESDSKGPMKSATESVSEDAGRGSSPSGDSGGGRRRAPNSDDTDGLSSERESEGGTERETSSSHGRQSTRSSHGWSNGKDSGMMLESTASQKSTNSQSLSPPSGSLAYSLLSTSSEHDPPSTSGCSSNQSAARVQTQKELMKAIKELKFRLPSERKSKGHSGTLSALKYALQCVRQVRANKEYYHQWSVEECHGCSLDLSAFTIEELDNITSEYTLKNTDTFSMAVSFLSGKVVYVSPQGSSVLRCKPECLQGTMFSELLAPQDVSTFYGGTAPCRLPLWASCIGSGESWPRRPLPGWDRGLTTDRLLSAASPALDCTQEKSMFCRISGKRTQGGEPRYYPFRLTPYQLTVRDSDTAEPQPCCLLIAERVHSGYEAPRIPPDKRIFTTSHTPSCLFQEVDERAVPLLGYLPQDLVGTPILLYIHPEDRPTLVAIHEKIFQFAGQPFEYAPLRMCARSGEYLTIDTSWSSFVNPWSRKVAFVVGRHKVRTSPLNEDVFTARSGEGLATTPDVVQLSEQIHRLLGQPVHGGGGSQGYSSLGSSGSRGSHRSHPQRPSASATSSSESNGPAAEEVVVAVAMHKPMTFQQICKDVHMVKTNGQQVFIESRNRPPLRKNAGTVVAKGPRAVNQDPARGLVCDARKAPKDLLPTPLVPKEAPLGYSYQQINCLDSIIRYLESCNVPNTIKRKCGSSSGTSASEEDKLQGSRNAKRAAVTLVGEAHPLPPLTLAAKAESVASVTSQCSFSSTIVHVGDKKPPESDIVMEEAPPTPTLSPPNSMPLASCSGPAANSALPLAPPPPPPPQASQTPQPTAPERDGRRGVGGVGGVGGAGRLGLTKEVLSAHTQQEEQAFLDRFKDLSKLRVFDQTASSTVRCHTPTANQRGVRCSGDYPSAGGGSGHRRGGKRLRHQEPADHHATFGLAGMPRDPESRSSAAPPMVVAAAAAAAVPGASTNSSSWPSVCSQPSIPSAPFAPGMLPMYPVYPPLSQPLAVQDPSRFAAGQMVPPMMALVLPNYMFPPMGAPVPQPAPAPLQFFGPNFNYPSAVPAPVPVPLPLPVPVPMPVCNMPVPVPMPVCNMPTVPGTGAASRSSTPQSYTQTHPDREGADSPLFQSRCSSPLNLLQLEEPPSGRLEGAAGTLASSQRATPPAPGGNGGVQSSTGQRNSADDAKDNENGEANESNNDAMSTSSDILDLLLQEDSRSGTGSAASGSGSSGTRSSGSGSGSGSNGCCSSGTSGTSSSQGSHTSKYFGSIDSLENEHARKQTAGGGGGDDGGEGQFIKCVLQDPIWLLMANTDDKVMMTYQLPIRDVETVLRQDRDTLRAMQKHQPRFNEEQKRELSQVHPWVRTGRLPRAVNVSGCAGCKSPSLLPTGAPFDVELHEMELCPVLKMQEATNAQTTTTNGHLQEEEEDDDEGPRDQEKTQAAAEDGARPT